MPCGNGQVTPTVVAPYPTVFDTIIPDHVQRVREMAANGAYRKDPQSENWIDLAVPGSPNSTRSLVPCGAIVVPGPVQVGGISMLPCTVDRYRCTRCSGDPGFSVLPVTR
jgi:hypothetical protein